MKKETINVTYLSPMTKVVELKPRQVIAASNPSLIEEGGETGESWES